ncbi:MAG: ATP-binding protein [Chloroflexota bacterium]
MTTQERVDTARALDEAIRLARLSVAVARASTARDVALVLLEELGSFDPDPTIAIALTDEATREFELVGVRSGGGHRIDVRERWSFDLPSPAADVVRTGEPLVLDERAYRACYPEISAVADPGGMVRYLALPIVAGSRSVGAVGLSWRREPTLSPRDLGHLQSLVDAAAQAIGRARMEEAERTTRRLMAAMVDQMPLGVLVISPAQPRPVYMNEAFAQIFGVGGEPTGAGAATTRVLRMDGTDWPEADRPLVRALLGETMRDELVILEPPDGPRRIASCNVGPVRDADGSIIAAVGIYADVTARVEAERARDAFLGVLSHELRTPVTAIYGGAELLARQVGDASPEVRELAGDIADEARRLHRIVEDLLVLSRLERGVDLSREDPVLLHHLVRRVVAGEAKRRPELRFDIQVEPGLPAVSGDEAYLEQIVRNLISNAAKFGPPDGRIRVVVERAGDRVRLRVRDDGPGFTAGEEEAVFELFYRAPATARTTAGAGIGLYTVRALAAAMGGGAWAATHPEGGAELTIALPILETA